MPKWKKYSWRELPRKALRRLARMVYYKQTMILYVLQIKLGDQDGNYEVICNHKQPEVIELLKKAYPKYVKLIDQRVKDGLRFCAACSPEGELVGSAWFAFNRFVDPAGHFVIDLAEDEIYSHDGKVEPKYRRSRVGASCYGWVLDRFWHEGFRKVVAVVNAQNLPAQKWHSFMGFREAGKKIHLRFIFGQPRHHWSTYAPEEGPEQVSS